MTESTLYARLKEIRREQAEPRTLAEVVVKLDAEKRKIIKELEKLKGTR